MSMVKGDQSSSSSSSTSSSSTTTTTTQGQDQNDVESFFATKDTNLKEINDAKSLLTQKAKSATKTNSCGICHELLKSQDKNNNNNNNPLSTTTTTTTTTELPTIHEIRSRLKRQQPMLSGSLNGNNKTIVDKLITLYKYLITFAFTIMSTMFFWFLDFCDYCTGGTGQVNIDNVTVIEGMYVINNNPQSTSTTATNRSTTRQNNTVAGFEDDDDDDYNTTGSSLSRSHGFAATMTHGGLDDKNTLQTQDDVVFQLPCQCFVHDICLRGFMLLGKHNICPSCKEVTTFDVFVSPWDSLYDNYKNFLDSVKYFIAINPLLLFVINILLYFLW